MSRNGTATLERPAAVIAPPPPLPDCPCGNGPLCLMARDAAEKQGVWAAYVRCALCGLEIPLAPDDVTALIAFQRHGTLADVRALLIERLALHRGSVNDLACFHEEERVEAQEQWHDLVAMAARRFREMEQAAAKEKEYDLATEVCDCGLAGWLGIALADVGARCQAIERTVRERDRRATSKQAA